MPIVNDIDYSWDDLRRVFEDQELQGRGIALNVRAPVHYAVYLEYGTQRGVGLGPGVPRPFMRWTFDAHSNYRWQLQKLGREILGGRMRGAGGRYISVRARLKEFGAHVVKDVQKTIDAMGLIDTGTLRASITATVERDGEAVSAGGEG